MQCVRVFETCIKSTVTSRYLLNSLKLLRYVLTKKIYANLIIFQAVLAYLY